MDLKTLNQSEPAALLTELGGLYEHSPWIVEGALAQRPFASLAAFKRACFEVLARATPEAQRALICAHPELAGKAMVAQQLTAESTDEQSRAGLTHCSPEEFATLQRLNTAYGQRFGWPFILAVRGPRGLGLSRSEIISTFERRLDGHPDFEFQECLRQIHRIAELRLAEKFGEDLSAGEQVWDWAEQLAVHSEADDALTVTYMSPAHRACARKLAGWMQSCGFDEVQIDALGNVVGRYFGSDPSAPLLMTGSHYDTVRNGGRYDGRLGILVAMATVQGMKALGHRPRHGLELVAFAEEEAQRFPATFLAASALVGRFEPQWLAQQDAQSVTMAEALQAAGHGAQPSAQLDSIAALQRDPKQYLGFVEVHIEQGPVLDAAGLPLGVVSSINGSHRYTGEIVGQASHAGTTPMGAGRRDAAAAAAELVLQVERIATQLPEAVGTVGMLEVPGGSINVVPGRCRFSLDLRAPRDAVRDRLRDEVLHALDAICERRGLHYSLRPTLSIDAAPSHPDWQARWEAAVQRLGLPVHRMPSGAGHDAMKMHEILPQAMLFVRGGNAGISHNPLETVSAHDAQLAVEAFEILWNSL
ncbi:N-carbamoyl-L-amino-acid hydrolase [Inhella inkyongensis]|uniref:N-carbamoyl-L-amino-acid hydrolase n=1 Tax=Inhella inkyongensis TaxID=392593 RepID=A0A840SAE3_9BURK|nr:2-oxo-4-hydroxy-4-carboxy-5-ureidoimidazoline decarboxylase [Inhella inkyongensis]MBB5205350.1 N-carbamoyl-L-amino-acid hydrolase [Inhella inkyongensis]